MSSSDEDIAWEECEDDDLEEDEEMEDEDVEMAIDVDESTGVGRRPDETSSPRDYLSRRRETGTKRVASPKAKARAAKRRRRVAVHKAGVVVFCARLGMLETCCGDALTRESAVALLETAMGDLKAAARGRSSPKAALEAAVRLSRLLAAARSQRKAETFGLSDPWQLARRVHRGDWTATEFTQLLAAAVRDAGFTVRLVGCHTPAKACVVQRHRDDDDDDDDELWLWVSRATEDRSYFVFVDVAGGTVSRRPPQDPAYVVAVDDAVHLVPDAGNKDRRALPKKDRDWLEASPLVVTEPRTTALRTSIAGLPTTRFGFKNHPTYAIKAMLPRFEYIKDGADSIAFFKGDRVYRRDDVIILRGERQWKKFGRAVKPGQEPKKDKLFAEDQTDPWEVPAVVGDNIPVNDYGNVDIVDGDPNLVPKGATWIHGKDAMTLAKHLHKTSHLPYAVVVTGFDHDDSKKSRLLPFSAGSSSSAANQRSFQRPPKPKKDGVVVPDPFAPTLRAALAALRATRAKEQHLLRRRRWANVVRKLLSREHLRDMYLPDRRRVLSSS